ncbi:MAG: acetyl-CoA C-acetyltransferase [Acidimicrobiia bacterium]
MRDAVICEPVRTAVGRYGGAFRQVSAADLAAAVIRGLVERTSLDPGQVDDVVLGQCYPSGEAPAIGRVAALDAGLPVAVPGAQVDRRCGSGLMAVIDAAMQVQTGAADLVLAGGAESMSQVELYHSTGRWPDEERSELHDRLVRARVTAGGRHHPVPGGMIETAENLRREYSISRQEQDELAAESHRRAVAARDRGDLRAEVVPLDLGGTGAVADDEGPRPTTSVEKLAQLPALMAEVDEAATVTAGNACSQSDGAAICIVTHPDKAAELGLRPLARLAGWAVAGVPPRVMGIGPVPATARVLGRLGLELSDVDLVELNEAFAAQVLACTREWGFAAADFERLNVNGSGISLGHPVGATGGRILATLLHELDRRGGRYGLETMCIGGGQGLAAVFERVGA